MDKHEIVSDIKRVASEIGHQPTRDEYLKLGKYSRVTIDKVFGLWTEAYKAAFGEFKKTNHTAGKEKYSPISSILAHHQDTEFKQKRAEIDYPIIIIGDTHFPFVDLDALTWAYSIIEIIKPKIVLQIGDVHDCFAQAKFPRSHNTYSPKEETNLAFKMAADMWRTIQTMLPGVKCYQMHGNHTTRPYKRIIEAAPTLEHLLDFDKYLTFDGVELIKDPREELMIGDIVFTHGWLSQLGAHRDYLMKNTVCGHSHSGGVSFKNIHGNILWELNAGYLGDPMSKALSYTSTKSTRWTHGLGLIDALGPMFIPKP